MEQKDKCLYHYAVHEYVHTIIPSQKVGVAESYVELEDSDGSSVEVRTLRKTFKRKKTVEPNDDNIDFVCDFSGTTEQDNLDAIGASHTTKTNVSLDYASIDFEKTDSCVVTTSSLRKPKALTLVKIRTMKKAQLIEYWVKNGIDSTGKVPMLKDRIIKKLKLRKRHYGKSSDSIDLTRKKDVNDYTSSSSLRNSRLLLGKQMKLLTVI